MTNFDEEKVAFGERMTELLIDNGYTKFGRGELKGIIVPNYTSFASAYVLKSGENLSYKSVEKWCKGEAYFGTKRYPVICEMLNTSQEWLMTGKGSREGSNGELINVIHEVESSEGLGLNSSGLGEPDIEEFVRVPVYDVELAAGTGGYSNGDNPVATMTVSAECLSRNNIYPPDASIVKVRGNSMESTLHNGDTILVDTAVKKPITNGIFAFIFDDELRVKRFSKQLDGTWRIISDNEDKNLYRDELISPFNIEKLKIIGQVMTIIERSLF